MTKFVDLVTNEILILLAKNCGKHYSIACKKTDPQIIEETKRQIKDIVLAQLDTFFDEFQKLPKVPDVEDSAQFVAHTRE